MKKTKAFTLAESILVLALIGLVAAITIPALHMSSPDTTKIKFKKAYNTINRAVDGVMNSDTYPEGDLSVGDFDIASTFCTQFAEMLNVSSGANCAIDKSATTDTVEYDYTDVVDSAGKIDRKCIPDNGTIPSYRFTTTDGAGFWGFQYNFNSAKKEGDTPFRRSDLMVICVNVDVTKRNTEGIFGFAIRNDGKVFAGAKADAILTEGANTITKTRVTNTTQEGTNATQGNEGE